MSGLEETVLMMAYAKSLNDWSPFDDRLGCIGFLIHQDVEMFCKKGMENRFYILGVT